LFTFEEDFFKNLAFMEFVTFCLKNIQFCRTLLIKIKEANSRNIPVNYCKVLAFISVSEKMLKEKLMVDT
jgi:hypothetical protein